VFTTQGVFFGTRHLGQLRTECHERNQTKAYRWRQAALQYSACKHALQIGERMILYQNRRVRLMQRWFAARRPNTHLPERTFIL
jgi:hypothetical protein